MSRVYRSAILVALWALVFAGLAQAQALKQVPSDAWFIVKVNNLQAVSGKLSTYATELGIAQMLPQLSDPLKALQQQTKMNNGVKTDGELVFAYLNPDVAGGAQDKSLLMLIPVSDYKAFVGNFSDAAKQGDLDVFRIGGDPGLTYSAQWGDYAAISPAKEVLAQKHEGLSVSGLSAKELDNKDIVLYANVPVLKARFLPQLQQSRANIQARIDRRMAQRPENAKYAPIIKALADQGLTLAEQFLSEGQAGTFGVSFGKEGISTTLLADMASSSTLGQLISKARNSDQSLLAGLPAGTYLIYGGMTQDPQAVGKLFDTLVGPVEKQMEASGDEGKKISALIGSLRAILTSTTGGASGLIAPTTPLGQGSLFQGFSVLHGDAKAIVPAQKQYFQAYDQMTSLVPNQGYKMQLAINEKAKTIDGVALDEIQLQPVVTAAPGTPEAAMAAQAVQMMNYIYGPNGMVSYIGTVNDNTVVYVFGIEDDAAMQNAITAARKGEDVLGQSPALKPVVAALPQKRAGAYYVALGDIVSTVVKYVNQQGVGIPLQMEANLPPVGMTLASEGSTVRADGYVPLSLMKNLVSAALQVQMHMMGGGGQGQPDGL